MLTFKNPSARLELEIGQEKASALGRQGRRLETALAVLRAYDSAHPQEAGARRSDRGRARLVADAGEAFWYLVVQRDACGLYGNAALAADYVVPAEVVRCAGPSPHEKAPRRPARGASWLVPSPRTKQPLAAGRLPAHKGGP